MAKNEAKVKFTAETSEFTSQITKVNSTMASLRAGLALNEAEFKNTGDAAEYLQNKQKLLKDQLDANREKQEALNGKVQAAKEIYGENSKEVQEWETKLTRAKIEEQKLQSAITETDKAVEDLTRDLDSEEKQLDETADATKEAGDAAEKSKDGFTVAKGVIANLASEGLTFLISKLKQAAEAVIKLGTEFTASLSNVEALSGATSNQMAKLEATAKELGRSTIFSATDVSDAFGYMALAGWDVQDMLNGIDGVLNLAASSNMDLAEASDMVTDYLSAFGLETADAARMVDELTYAQANSNTTTAQLGDAFGNSAAMMHTAGQTMETTTAILEAFANQGMKGSEAGTALSAMVRDITQKMEDGQIMIGDTAVTVQDANGNFRNMIDILADVEAATDGMGSAEKSAALMTTFTARSVKGVSEALTEGTDNLRSYEDQLYACSGTAEEMTEVMQDNLSGDLKELGSAAQGLGLQLFDYFEGPLRGAAQLATDALNWITDAITPQRTELDNFIEEIEESNRKVEGIIEKADQALQGGTDSVAELEYYRDLLIDLNNKTSLNEWEQYQLKNAVEELGGSIPELADAFDETNGTLSITNEQLTDLFDNAMKVAMQTALIEAQQDSYKALAEAELNKAKADAAVEAAQKAANEATQGSIENNELMSQTMRTATDGANDYARALAAQQEAEDQIAEINEQINLENEAFADLREQYGLTTETISEAAEEQKAANEANRETGEILEEQIQLVNEYGDAIDESGNLIVEELSEERKAFYDLRDSVRESMQDSVSFMEEFSGGTKITADEMLKNLTSQKEGIANWAENMQTLAGEVGSGMTQEMYDALLEMGPQSANAVQTLVDTLKGNPEQFKEIADTWAEAINLSENADVLASYSQTGKDAGIEIADGIRTSSGEIENAVGDAINEAAENADTKSERIPDAVGDAMDEAKAEIQNAKLPDAMRDTMDGVKSEVTTAMSGALTEVQSYISQMSAALGVTIKGPNVQVPHFNVSGAFNLQQGTVPTVGVSWWAKGGVFTRPTIFNTPYGLHGVGEAGHEAVMPIETLRDYISDAIESGSNGTDVNVYMTVNGAEDPAAWGAELARELKQQMRIS